MSQIARLDVTETLGLRPSQICENLDNCQATELLPTGAFKLINTIDSELINGPKRAEVLGHSSLT